MKSQSPTWDSRWLGDSGKRRDLLMDGTFQQRPVVWAGEAALKIFWTPLIHPLKNEPEEWFGWRVRFQLWVEIRGIYQEKTPNALSCCLGCLMKKGKCPLGGIWSSRDGPWGQFPSTLVSVSSLPSRPKVDKEWASQMRFLPTSIKRSP